MDSKEDFERSGSSVNGSGGVIAGEYPSCLSEGILPTPPPPPAWTFVTDDDDDATPPPLDIVDPEAVQPLSSAASEAADGASVKETVVIASTTSTTGPADVAPAAREALLVDTAATDAVDAASRRAPPPPPPPPPGEVKAGRSLPPAAAGIRRPSDDPPPSIPKHEDIVRPATCDVRDDGHKEENDDDDDDSDDEGGRGKKKHSRSACNVSLGNRDLSNIVNGFPGDNVSKKPFDYTFTKANIINSWIAVGFLPMTANAVNDPKVRYELGEGGAPEAEQKRIADLVEDYHKSRDELEELGFNADILDLQPKVAENHPIPADEEAAIEALMKKGGANKAGSLFRVGISVVNCRVVLETLRRTKEQAEKVKEQKEKSRQVVEDGKVKAALEAFGKWCGNGMKLDGESHPVMTRTCAVAIVKV